MGYPEVQVMYHTQITNHIDKLCPFWLRPPDNLITHSRTILESINNDTINTNKKFNNQQHKDDN